MSGGVGAAVAPSQTSLTGASTSSLASGTQPQGQQPIGGIGSLAGPNGLTGLNQNAPLISTTNSTSSTDFGSGTGASVSQIVGNAGQQPTGGKAGGGGQPQQQMQQQSQLSPYQQPQRPQYSPYSQGLQQLFGNMMPAYGRFNPQNNASAYRPNMQNAQESLNRVRPSVQKQDQDTQAAHAARIAELEAELATYKVPGPGFQS